MKHPHAPSGGGGFLRSCLRFLFKDAEKPWGAMPAWVSRGVAGATVSTAVPRGPVGSGHPHPAQQWKIWSPCKFIGGDNESSAPSRVPYASASPQICHLLLRFLAAGAGSVPYVLQAPTPPTPPTPPALLPPPVLPPCQGWQEGLGDEATFPWVPHLYPLYFSVGFSHSWDFPAREGDKRWGRQNPRTPRHGPGRGVRQGWRLVACCQQLCSSPHSAAKPRARDLSASKDSPP